MTTVHMRHSRARTDPTLPIGSVHRRNPSDGAAAASTILREGVVSKRAVKSGRNWKDRRIVPRKDSLEWYAKDSHRGTLELRADSTVRPWSKDQLTGAMVGPLCLAVESGGELLGTPGKGTTIAQRCSRFTLVLRAPDPDSLPGVARRDRGRNRAAGDGEGRPNQPRNV